MITLSSNEVIVRNRSKEVHCENCLRITIGTPDENKKLIQLLKSIPAVKKVLFIDSDGTLIKEAPPTYQLDSFSKLEFYPDMFLYMRKIAEELDYELVMVTNQDGLGTASFPEDSFWPVHNLVMTSLVNEDIFFSEVYIDRTYPKDNAPTRKPGTGMLTGYLNKTLLMIWQNSFVIGDRITDMQLAKNIGCKGFWLNIDASLGAAEIKDKLEELRKDTIVLESPHWKDIYDVFKIAAKKSCSPA